MSCCSTHTAEDKFEPYQLRALYIRQISKFAQMGIFGQALNVFKEVSLYLTVRGKLPQESKLPQSAINYLMPSIGCNAISFKNLIGVPCLCEFTWLQVSQRVT